MTHTSLETRKIIEYSLKEGKNFTEISALVGFHRTIISDEVIENRILDKQRTYGIA